MGDGAHLPTLTREFAAVKAGFTRIQKRLQAILEKEETEELDAPDARGVEQEDDKLDEAIERAKEITNEIVRLHTAAETYTEIPPITESRDDLLEHGVDIKIEIRHLRLRFPDALADARRRQGPPPAVKTDPDPDFTAADFLKLPAQQLPKFGGVHAEWNGFWDQFDSSIDKRAGMSDVHKLLYLRSCLVGEPFDLIKSLVVRNDNYPVAIRIITERYQDSEMVEQELIDALFGAPGVQRDNPASLRKLLNILKEKIQALRNANVSMEGFTWGYTCSSGRWTPRHDGVRRFSRPTTSAGALDLQ